MDAIVTIQQVGRDPDVAMELGALGTHKQLVKAAMGTFNAFTPESMSVDQREDAVEQASAALAACSECLPPGAQFPAKPALQAVMGLNDITALAMEAQTAAHSPCCPQAAATFTRPSHIPTAAETALHPSAESTTAAVPASTSTSTTTLSHWLLHHRPHAKPSMSASAAESSLPVDPICCFCESKMPKAIAAVVEAEANLAQRLRAGGVAPELPFRFYVPSHGAKGFAIATTSHEAGDVDEWAEGLHADEGPRFPELRDGYICVRKLSMRMASHDDVGAVLWPAAGVLSRWLLDRKWLLRDKVVMEIGAGMGLTGIVAATICFSAVLTDFNAAVIKNLEQNIQLNSGPKCFVDAGQVDKQPTSALQAARVTSGWMDWDSIGVDAEASSEAGSAPGAGARAASCPHEVPNASETKADVILATDMVISKADCEGVARACANCLLPGGYAIFAVAPPDVRFGTEYLKASLEDSGFTVLQQSVPPEYAVGCSYATAGGYESRIQLYAAFR